MIELVILVALGFYVTIAIFVTKRLLHKGQSQTRKWIVGSLSVLAFSLPPIWDEIAGGIYFTSLCKNMAGQKINTSVRLGDEFFLLPGEVDTNTAGKTLAKGGELNHEKLKSVFQTGKVSERVSKYFRIDKETRIVSNLRTSEVLATDTRFYFFGGWLINSTGLHVSGRTCPERDERYYRDFYAAIFKRGQN